MSKTVKRRRSDNSKGMSYRTMKNDYRKSRRNFQKNYKDLQMFSVKSYSNYHHTDPTT